MAEKIDPITLEVLWNRLLSVVNEQQVTLMRTAFSTVVRESQDLACGVFDTRGYMVAQSLTGTPGHINGSTPFFESVSGGNARAGGCADYQRSLANSRADQRYDGTFPGLS